MRRFWSIGTVSVLLLVLYFAIRLNSHPTIIKTHHGFINQDLIAQLSFLKEKLNSGADDEMQAIFPEGYLFINSLYGLAWANVIINSGKDNSVYTKGITNIKTTLAKIRSQKGKQPFQEGLPLAYGAFYKGWTNYLTGKMLLAQHPKDRDSTDIINFINTCEEIKNAYNKSETVYLESYYGARWPADNILCIASLALHDQLFSPKYQGFLKQEIVKIKSFIDPATGLIPHAVSDDQVLEGARGSSQSLINVFLKGLDTNFAKQQYSAFKINFIDYRLGLPGIREYPKDKTGKGDIDAGPVIWDIGGSASIVGIASAEINGDKELSRSLRNSIEAFGIPVTFSNEKKYLFGQMPMADAFIAWVNSEAIN